MTEKTPPPTELPIKPVPKKPPRVHLESMPGSRRSCCRHTSRPSRTRVKARCVSLAVFLQTPQELRCLECQRAADRRAEEASGDRKE